MFKNSMKVSCRLFLLLGLIEVLRAQTTDVYLDDFDYETTTAANARDSGQDENVIVQEGEQTHPKCTAQTSLASKSGQLLTPNYPDEYPNNVTCMWTIQAPKDRHIYLYFQKFDLEEGLIDSPLFGRFGSPECHFDMVYIVEEVRDAKKDQGNPKFFVRVDNFHDGDSPHKSKSRRIIWGIFCGKNAPPPRMTETAGSRLVVLFHSDRSRTRAGFWATFHTIKAKDLRNAGEGNKSLDEEDSEDLFDLSKWPGKDSGVKRAYVAVVLFVIAVVFIMAILHCFQGSTLCDSMMVFRSPPRASRSVPSVLMNMFGPNGRGENTSPTPSTPSPPPAYGEIVKTEEDWQRALERIGETEESIERYRSHPHNIQIEYDIIGGGNRAVPSNTSSQTRTSLLSSSTSSTAPMYDPRSGITDNFLPGIITDGRDDRVQSTRLDGAEARIEDETFVQQLIGENVERSARPPFTSPIH